MAQLKFTTTEPVWGASRSYYVEDTGKFYDMTGGLTVDVSTLEVGDMCCPRQGHPAEEITSIETVEEE